MNCLAVLFICFSFCSSRSDSEIGFPIRVLPRSSPLSPYFDPNCTVHDLLQAERQRLEYRRSVGPNDDTSLPIGYVSGYYVGEVSIGSPAEKRFFQLDTGSHLIWLQCDTCRGCPKRRSPGFNPDNSATYKYLKCDDLVCRQGAYYCDEDSATCRFTSRYADNDSSSGFMGTDDFHLSTAVGTSHDIPGVVFGCAEEDHRSPWSVPDGILGLGLGEESFVSQAKVDRFSYCIPPEPATDTESYQKMLFGSMANLAGRTTPFTSNEGLYFLRLVGVSLLTVRFSIPDIVKNGHMDMAVDSGTTGIWLHPTAYRPLSSALREVLRLRAASADCYLATMSDVAWVSVTFQFEGGVDVRVPGSNLFYETGGRGVCAALFPTSHDWMPSILGIRAQMDYNVGYDLAKKQVSFLSTDCSSS